MAAQALSLPASDPLASAKAGQQKQENYVKRRLKLERGVWYQIGYTEMILPLANDTNDKFEQRVIQMAQSVYDEDKGRWITVELEFTRDDQLALNGCTMVVEHDPRLAEVKDLRVKDERPAKAKASTFQNSPRRSRGGADHN